MYQTFSEYKETRESFDFNSKVISLYENIIQSEVSFDDWWEKKGLPVILEQAYSDEEELLMEWAGGMGNFLGNAAGKITQGAQNFGRGLAAGWKQGRQDVPVWQSQQGQEQEQGQGNTDPNAPYAQPTSQNPYPQRGSVNPQDILQTHQTMMQKLKDLEAHYTQNQDNKSYAAIRNLRNQMNQLPNMVRNMVVTKNA